MYCWGGQVDICGTNLHLRDNVQRARFVYLFFILSKNVFKIQTARFSTEARSARGRTRKYSTCMVQWLRFSTAARWSLAAIKDSGKTKTRSRYSSWAQTRRGARCLRCPSHSGDVRAKQRFWIICQFSQILWTPIRLFSAVAVDLGPGHQTVWVFGGITGPDDVTQSSTFYFKQNSWTPGPGIYLKIQKGCFT